MEVSVLAQRGLPAEAMLSVRAGSFRRQAPVAANKPFRFAESTAGAEGLLRFDVLQRIGRGFVILKPETEQYKVALDEGSGMNLEVAVKKLEGGAVCSAGADSAPSPEPAASAREAKDYLEAKGVLKYIQAMLQLLIKEKPADPFQFMVGHMQAAGGEAVSEAAAGPEGQGGGEPEAFSEEKVQKATLPEETQADLVDALRFRVQGLLVSGLTDGTLKNAVETIMQEVPSKVSTEKSRKQAAESEKLKVVAASISESFAEAAKSGDLALIDASESQDKACFEDVQSLENVADSLSKSFAEAAKSGDLVAMLKQTNESKEVSQLRDRVAQTLSAAIESGDLRRAVEEQVEH